MTPNIHRVSVTRTSGTPISSPRTVAASTHATQKERKSTVVTAEEKLTVFLTELDHWISSGGDPAVPPQALGRTISAPPTRSGVH